jgi:uncharacterized membrane protein (UPF0127 family)
MTHRTRCSRSRAFAALVLVTLAATVGCHAQASLLSLDSFPKSRLHITSGTEKHEFDIWIATTPEQQQQGLMFVRDLPSNHGMLFLADAPRVFRMWMKNTYIPLDMVFIGADGRVAKIAANTVPHSLATVSSGTEVSGILEIRGGEAARRAIHVGDAVSWTKAAPPQPSP